MKLRQGQGELGQLLDAAGVAPAHGGELQRFPGQKRSQELLDDAAAEIVGIVLVMEVV